MVTLTRQLFAVSILGEANTLSAEATAAAARQVNIKAQTSASVTAAVTEITARHPNSRILICGSLYLAGQVLRENS